MKFQFEFEDVSSSGDIKEKIANKFSSLEKYLTHVKEDFHQAWVRVMKGERFGYKVKVDLKLPGKEVVAEGTGKTLLNAMDEAHENVSRIVRKYFEKLQEKKR